jgi:hypothetical protein
LRFGLSLRQITIWARRRRKAKPTLLRQAIVEQLPQRAMEMPKVLLATAGSATPRRRSDPPGQGREGRAGRVLRATTFALSYKLAGRAASHP